MGTTIDSLMTGRQELNARMVIKREFHYMVETVRQARRVHSKDHAATIAFWTFFSIFPLLIGVISLGGYFLESTRLQDGINEAITNIFPGSASLIHDNIESVIRLRGTMSWVGIATLLWSAGKGFGAITRAINRVIGANRTHFFLISKLRYFFMAVAVSVLAIVSVGSTAVIEIALDPSFLSQLGIGAVEIPRLEGWGVSFVMVSLMFLLIYKITPYVDVTWRQIVPGSLLAAVLFEFCKALFLLYLDRFAHFETVYGSLSSIIVLLLWLYLSGRILIFGVVYNIVRSWSDVPSADSIAEEKE
jgi:membrane protein